MFLSKRKKKWGLKGSKLYRYVFGDDYLHTLFKSRFDRIHYLGEIIRNELNFMLFHVSTLANHSQSL